MNPKPQGIFEHENLCEEGKKKQKIIFKVFSGLNATLRLGPTPFFMCATFEDMLLRYSNNVFLIYSSQTQVCFVHTAEAVRQRDKLQPSWEK